MIVKSFVRAFLTDDAYDINGDLFEGPIQLSFIPCVVATKCEHIETICVDCMYQWEDYFIEGRDSRFLRILRGASEIVSRIPTSAIS